MAKKKTRRSRNYAANEATLINIRALKRCVTKLEAKVAALEALLTSKPDVMGSYDPPNPAAPDAASTASTRDLT